MNTTSQNQQLIKSETCFSSLHIVHTNNHRGPWGKDIYIYTHESEGWKSHQKGKRLITNNMKFEVHLRHYMLPQILFWQHMKGSSATGLNCAKSTDVTNKTIWLPRCFPGIVHAGSLAHCHDLLELMSKNSAVVHVSSTNCMFPA